MLNCLVEGVYQQNLTLKQAGERILQARAQLGIATGNLFPQMQSVNGSFTQTALSARTPT